VASSLKKREKNYISPIVGAPFVLDAKKNQQKLTIKGASSLSTGAVAATAAPSVNEAVFTSIEANGATSVFRSQITYTNNADRLTIVNNGKTYTIKQMLSQGYRWEKEVNVTRPRRFLKFLGDVDVRKEVYYTRYGARIRIHKLSNIVDGEPQTVKHTSTHLAYVADGKCYAMKPLELFESLRIKADQIEEIDRTMVPVYEISLGKNMYRINKAQVDRIVLNNVWVREVRDKLAEELFLELEWDGDTRIAVLSLREYFALPTPSTTITSNYGWRTPPTEGASSNHTGIDIGAVKPGVEGDPLYSVMDGTVTFADSNGGYGNTVKIVGDGYYDGKEVTVRVNYSHIQRNMLVNANDSVLKGQMIATMGNTGTSTGAHLHIDFEISYDGGEKYQYVNPRDAYTNSGTLAVNPNAKLTPGL